MNHRSLRTFIELLAVAIGLFCITDNVSAANSCDSFDATQISGANIALQINNDASVKDCTIDGSNRKPSISPPTDQIKSVTPVLIIQYFTSTNADGTFNIDSLTTAVCWWGTGGKYICK